MKVWLGLLDDALVGRISYEEGDEPECSFKGFGALSGVSMVPFGPALASIAGEHFAFVTAVAGLEEPGFPEEPEQSWEARLGMSNLQKKRLLGAGGVAAPAVAPPVETPAGAGVGLPIAEAPLPGLDPTGAARQAGIPEAQLNCYVRCRGSREKEFGSEGKTKADECFGRVGGRRACGAGGTRDYWGSSFSGSNQCVHRGTDGRRLLASSDGPRQEIMVCSARGWVEHRSHLQQYAGPIRPSLVAGRHNRRDSGSPEQAKAMALLGLASLDQAAIDGGNWLLASEYSLESAPPFSSFQRPRALDPLESKQTKLIDPRWVSLFMSRLKERDAFHAAKRNLSSGGFGGAAPSGSEAPNGGQPDPPRRPPRKPKGKGDGKGDKEKT